MKERQRSMGVEPVTDLSMAVSVVIAERMLPLDQILQLRPGAVVELGKDPDAPLDLVVGESRVGKGKAVDVGDRLGFLVEEITSIPAGKPRGPRS